MRHRVGPRRPLPAVGRLQLTHLVSSDETWGRSGAGSPRRLPAGELHLVTRAAPTRTLCGLPAGDFPFVFPDRAFLPATGRRCEAACREYFLARPPWP